MGANKVKECRENEKKRIAAQEAADNDLVLDKAQGDLQTTNLKVGALYRHDELDDTKTLLVTFVGGAEAM